MLVFYHKDRGANSMAKDGGSGRDTKKPPCAKWRGSIPPAYSILVLLFKDVNYVSYSYNYVINIQ